MLTTDNRPPTTVHAVVGGRWSLTLGSSVFYSKEVRVRHSLRHACALALFVILSVFIPVRSALAANFVVNSTGNEADASTADGICQTASSVCTLRAAIQQANASAGAD